MNTRKMKRPNRITGIALAAILLAAGTAESQTSKVRTLEIQNGRVVLDGTVVPAAELPPGLDSRAVVLNMRFSEPARAYFEINDRFFVVDGSRIVPAAPRPSTGEPADVRFAFSTIQQELNTLGREINRSAGVERERLMGRQRELLTLINSQAREAAQRAYVHTLQDRDRPLYERLEREAEMEAETRRLAVRLREMPEGPERARTLDELRENLTEIFELKQQNRRAEIEQLESRMVELRSRLSERERHKKEIIQRRIDDLMGRSAQTDW